MLVTRVPKVIATLSVLCLCLVQVACGPSMGKYNLSVTPSESLKADKSVGSFEVHLVGVSDLDVAKWEAKKNSEYFSGPSTNRDNDETVKLSFPVGKRETQVVKKDDPVWGKGWSAARYIFVFASLPDATAPLKLPRDSDIWPGDTIVLEVRQNGVISKTLAKPKN